MEGRLRKANISPVQQAAGAAAGPQPSAGAAGEALRAPSEAAVVPLPQQHPSPPWQPAQQAVASRTVSTISC